MHPVARTVLARKSCRQFLKDKPVSDDLIKELLEHASRAPSGGNLQSWTSRVYVVNGKARDEMVEFLQGKAVGGSEYDIYPTDLGEPYRSRRAKVGADMYDLLGVGKKDTASKMKHVQRNFEFFDAPAGIFFTVELNNPPQWSDIGMFMQTFMLLATERGLATCAQEAWANHAPLVKEYFNIPGEHILFAAIALGYEDTSAPVNKLKTDRAPISEFVTFVQPRGSKL